MLHIYMHLIGRGECNCNGVCECNISPLYGSPYEGQNCECEPQIACNNPFNNVSQLIKSCDYNILWCRYLAVIMVHVLVVVAIAFQVIRELIVKFVQ